MSQGIFIVAGHGYGSSGAVDNGVSAHGTNERVEVLAVAQQLMSLLRSDSAFSATEIIDIGIQNRMQLMSKIQLINSICIQRSWQKHDTLLISIHINGAGSDTARGLEAWYTESEQTESAARALVEQMQLTTHLPLRRFSTRPTRMNRFGRLGIIDDTVPRSVLVELGFLTNAADAAYIQSSGAHAAFAQGLHRGIRMIEGVHHADPTPVPSSPSFYTDVPAHAWYRDDVALCLKEGIFRMPPNRLFHPAKPVTRAELAATLARHIRHRNS